MAKRVSAVEQMAQMGKPSAEKKADEPKTDGATGGQSAASNARPAVDRNAVVEVLQYTNPKRGASRARFAHYKTGMTVDEYIKLAGTKGAADIRWDQETHGPGPLIKLHPPGTKLKDSGKRVTS